MFIIAIDYLTASYLYIIIATHSTQASIINMSYIILDKKTNKSVCEIFNSNLLQYLNYDKYYFESAKHYLQELNKSFNNGMTYKDKILRGIIK